MKPPWHPDDKWAFSCNYHFIINQYSIFPLLDYFFSMHLLPYVALYIFLTFLTWSIFIYWNVQARVFFCLFITLSPLLCIFTGWHMIEKNIWGINELINTKVGGKVPGIENFENSLFEISQQPNQQQRICTGKPGIKKCCSFVSILLSSVPSIESMFQISCLNLVQRINIISC